MSESEEGNKSDSHGRRHTPFTGRINTALLSVAIGYSFGAAGLTAVVVPDLTKMHDDIAVKNALRGQGSGDALDEQQELYKRALALAAIDMAMAPLLVFSGFTGESGREQPHAEKVEKSKTEGGPKPKRSGRG